MIPSQIYFITFLVLFFLIISLITWDLLLITRFFRKSINQMTNRNNLKDDVEKIQSKLNALVLDKNDYLELESICPTNAITTHSNDNTINLDKNSCLGIICLNCLDFLENDD